MIEEAFTKRRLLDALEYIDDEYIASAARYKMKIKPHSDEPPVQTIGGSLKKYWKQYLGLVACLLLLAFASPIFSFVAQNITSLLAGAGIGTTEKQTAVQMFDENGVLYTYLMFVDDLEPISVEVMIDVNEAYKRYRYDDLFLIYYSNYKLKMDDSTARKEADAYVSSYLAGEETHKFFNEKELYYHKYLGVINDCVVLAVEGNIAVYDEFELAGYIFPCSPFNLTVYVNGEIRMLDDAYEDGLLNDDDIRKVHERFYEYNKFREVWLDELNKSNKEQNDIEQQ